MENYLDRDVDHHIVTLFGLRENAEVELVVDTGLLVSRQLKCFKLGVFDFLKGIMAPAHQIQPCLLRDQLHIACWPGCSPLYGSNVAPEKHICVQCLGFQVIFCLGVGVAKTTVADVQTVPVLRPIVSWSFEGIFFALFWCGFILPVG